MERFFTLKEVEEILNVSKSTLQRWDNSGKLKAYRTKGGHRRYKQTDIENILKIIDDISYGTLYEHLCSAEYIAHKLNDNNSELIIKIRKEIGQKLLNEHSKWIKENNID